MSELCQTRLVGTDGSAEAQCAVSSAAGWRRRPAQRSCWCMPSNRWSNLSTRPLRVQPLIWRRDGNNTNALSRRSGRLRSARAGVAHTVQLSEDTPIEALLAAAAEHKADLVVIGSHGSPGWQDRIFGRVANALPPRLGGPVVIVPVRPAA